MDVARAWAAEGIDVDEAFEAAASVTEEWTYVRTKLGNDSCANVAKRFTAKFEEKRRTPLRMRTLSEVLNPQPETAMVLHGLLDWIERADLASQNSLQRPPLLRADGAPLFPEGPWWQTDLSKHAPKEETLGVELDDAPFDDADLTIDPNEAGADASDTDTATDNDESDDSLPAGPPRPRSRSNAAQIALSQWDSCSGLASGSGMKRRLRVKTTSQTISNAAEDDAGTAEPQAPADIMSQLNDSAGTLVISEELLREDTSGLRLLAKQGKVQIHHRD